MNSTQKSELMNIQVDGIHIPSAIPEADMKTCMAIDGHSLIQALGKPHYIGARRLATMPICS